MESARADFNFWELPYYLISTYEILSLLLKCIGEQDSVKKIVKGITCCHGNPIFDTMFSQILTFDIFSFNDFFKTIANSLSQSQKIDIFS